MKRNLTVALVLSSLACGDGGTSGSQPTSDASGILSEVILPAVDGFQQASADLGDAAASVCAMPSGLAAARQQWVDTAGAWRRLAVFDFGPLDDDLVLPTDLFVESMRQRGIDYTETVRERIESALSSTVALDEAYFDRLRFTEVGLLAIEVLLFESTEPSHPTDLTAVAADFEARARKCAYLDGMARHLAQTAAVIREGWRGGVGVDGRPFAEQFDAARLPTGERPIVRVILALASELEYIERRKLDGQLDAELSGEFYPLLAQSIASTRAVLDAGEPSLRGSLEERSPDVAERLRSALTAAETAASNEARDAASTAFSSLVDLLRGAVPRALDIRLSLEFSDGD